jgi:signal transduction histidine kinase
MSTPGTITTQPRRSPFEHDPQPRGRSLASAVLLARCRARGYSRFVESATTAEALEELLREQAALRRIATLVARAPLPAELFAAVTREVGMLLGAQRATLLRVVEPQWAEVAASWSDGSAPPVPVGHRGALDGRGIVGKMLRTVRPVRIEDFDEVGGRVAALMRELEIRSGAGGPIVLRGRVWGAVTAVWPAEVSMPAGAEDRVAAFAELVSYAIENAEAQLELTASRARIVTTADDTRRRIERDLHDGAQQRLVAAALELTLLDRRLEQDPEGARDILARARAQLDCGLGELRDLARGIHPTVLTERGLEAALHALVQRAPLPVELSATIPQRLDAAIEAAAYYLVSEALTNVAKHAQADSVSVDVAATHGVLDVTIADNGVGGAHSSGGSGLRGLVDRVHAVGGRLEISSPAGQGTRLCARLPTNVLGPLYSS